MSYLLPHLHSAWDVDRAIVNEESRVVVLRFGRDAEATCMRVDDCLAGIAESVKNFAAIFLVDVGEVPDFNDMYELYDPCTVMFFFRNKHIMIDLGTGNNNKITWPVEKQARAVQALCALPARASTTRQCCLRGASASALFLRSPCPPSSPHLRPRPRPRAQDMIDIIETCYRGARKGRGLVVSPKDYSTRYKY